MSSNRCALVKMWLNMQLGNDPQELIGMDSHKIRTKSTHRTNSTNIREISFVRFCWWSPTGESMHTVWWNTLSTAPKSAYQQLLSTANSVLSNYGIKWWAGRFNSNFIDVLTIILKWADPGGIVLATTPVTKRIFLVAICFVSSFADFLFRGVDWRVAADDNLKIGRLKGLRSLSDSGFDFWFNRLCGQRFTALTSST